MNLKGEYQLTATKDEVWCSLNDLDVLQECIPGCEELVAVSDTCSQARIRARVGPVNAKFNTEINLEDVRAPDSYSLVVNSKGGAAGMGEGVAHIVLEENSTGTLLTYTVEFKVKGKLAQIGSRLIMNVIQKMSNEFFSSFAGHFPEEKKTGKDTEVTSDGRNTSDTVVFSSAFIAVLIVVFGAALYWVLAD